MNFRPPATMELPKPTPKELAMRALQANQEHQYALAQYVTNLDFELAELDKLLSQADTEDVDSDLECDFYIPNSNLAVGPIRNFSHPNSPFCEDTMKRNRYLNFTIRRTMTAKEVEALKAAVNAELRRVEQLEGASSTTTDAQMTDKLNWNVIAEKVSDSSNTKRTAQDCKIKWIGDLSTTTNRGAWSPSEVQTLQKIIKNKSNLNWVEVALELGTNRLPMDCMRQVIDRPRHVWTAEADKKLMDAVKQYGLAWSLVAKYVAPNVTAGQCSSRFLRTLDPTLRHTKWTAEEDQRLVAAVSGYGTAAWSDVAGVMPGRTNEQCRDRWAGTLDPAKGGKKTDEWDEEKDKALIAAVDANGRRWKAIALQIGHSASACRLHYDLLKKTDFEGYSPVAGPSTMPSEGDETEPTSALSTPRAKKVQPQAPIDPPTVTKPARPRPRALAKNNSASTGTKRAAPDPEETAPRKRQQVEEPRDSHSHPGEDVTSTDLVLQNPEPTRADTSSPSPTKKGKRCVPQASSLPRRRSARLNSSET
ncbi:hypothetical protein B0H19DRAFT_1177200 [Mycena capillaripes]|nr:hypothetical protein B0H19DRAFT_1177200 [Mycena capillaripes]